MATIVKVYADDGSTFLRCSFLRDCFPNDDENGTQEYAAREEIQRAGRVWIGGGDEPLFYVTKA
jgi:hypothetical protein